MDQMALRSGKAGVKGDLREDSDNDLEEDVQQLMEEGYAVGGNEDEEILPPRRTDDVDNPRPPLLPAMDIFSVRYPPTLATTLADQTSARGLPRSLVEPLRSSGT